MSTDQDLPGTGEHVDAEQLADLREGLLEPERAAAVDAHLVGCATCRATRDALDDVQAMLAGAPDAVPVPHELAARLDAALAAEATAADAAPEPAPVAASATVTPFPEPRRSPWSTRLLQAAAVFVLLAAAAGIGYGALRGGNGGAGGDGGATGQDRSAASAGSVYRITASGRDYTAGSLRAAVPGLLTGAVTKDDGAPAPQLNADSSGRAGDQQETSGGGSGPAAATRLADPAALADCVANVAERAVTPLAVDVGTFAGKPATVIVLPDPDDAAMVDVYAVEPACPKGFWLDFERVPRP